MKIYFVAGEKSGDKHAAELLKHLKQLNPDTTARAMGSEHLRDAGADIFLDNREVAFMGFLEVIKNLFTIQKALSRVKRDILDFSPDLLVLVDFAGFNLRLAAFAKSKGLKVCYFIPPKVWAWNTGRVEKIRKNVDLVLVILPFEADFFAKHSVKAHYVGNPSREQIDDFLMHADHSECLSTPMIALLPGSRKQEIQSAIGVFNQLPAFFPNHQFKLAGISALPKEYYNGLSTDIELDHDNTYDLLKNAEAAIVTSGTATLECALIGTPQVVVYRTSRISYSIAKRLIKVPFISLVNLLAGKKVVDELIQDAFSLPILVEKLRGVVVGGTNRENILKGYSEIRNALGNEKASQQAARLILKSFNEN